MTDLKIKLLWLCERCQNTVSFDYRFRKTVSRQTGNLRFVACCEEDPDIYSYLKLLWKQLVPRVATIIRSILDCQARVCWCDILNIKNLTELVSVAVPCLTCNREVLGISTILTRDLSSVPPSKS
jgi:hypothetical protein